MFQKINRTGIPDRMKKSAEALSGFSYDKVRVEFHSGVPGRFGALAVTQNNRIYVAQGQEHTLGHELWHIAQQAQGRVRPSFFSGDVAVNDSPILEREADAVGGRIMGGASSGLELSPLPEVSVPIQRKVGLEFQTVGGNRNVAKKVDGKNIEPGHGEVICKYQNYNVTTDGGDLEYVLDAVDESAGIVSIAALAAAAAAAAAFHKAITGTLITLPRSPTITTPFYKSNINSNEVYFGKYILYRNGEKTAHPQATLGVIMDRLLPLYHELSAMPLHPAVPATPADSIRFGSTKLVYKPQRQQRLLTDAETAVAVYTATHADLSSAGRTLLALLGQYAKGYALTLDTANAKNAMPVMSRTSLKDIYLLAKSQEEAAHIPAPLPVDVALQDTEFLTKLLGKAPDDAILAGQKSSWVTFRDWKLNILKVAAPKDILAEHFHGVSELTGTQTSAEDSQSSALKRFEIQRATDVGRDTAAGNVEGILVELRALERKVPTNRWAVVARRIATLAHDLNDPAHPITPATAWNG